VSDMLDMVCCLVWFSTCVSDWKPQNVESSCLQQFRLCCRFVPPFGHTPTVWHKCMYSLLSVKNMPHCL